MEKENQNKCPINIFTFLSVDESYHRNASCVLNIGYTRFYYWTHIMQK
jgi:phosphomevalonate kinase